MQAVYISLENRDEAFYLNGRCIVLNDTGAGDTAPVFEIAQETAFALETELVIFEHEPVPEEDDWNFGDVYERLMQ